MKSAKIPSKHGKRLRSTFCGGCWHRQCHFGSIEGFATAMPKRRLHPDVDAAFLPELCAADCGPGSCDELWHWPTWAIQRLRQVDHTKTLAENFKGHGIDLTTDYSGVGTAEIAMHFISIAMQRQWGATERLGGLPSVRYLSAGDLSSHCRALMQHHGPSTPECASACVLFTVWPEYIHDTFMIGFHLLTLQFRRTLGYRHACRHLWRHHSQSRRARSGPFGRSSTRPPHAKGLSAQVWGIFRAGNHTGRELVHEGSVEVFPEFGPFGVSHQCLLPQVSQELPLSSSETGGRRHSLALQWPNMCGLQRFGKQQRLVGQVEHPLSHLVVGEGGLP